MNINVHRSIDSLQYQMEQKREFYSQVFRSLGCLKLWEARHSMVLDFIDQNQVLSMLDLGTSESTLLMKVQRGVQVCQLVGLDIDDQVISQAIDNLMPQGIQNDYQYLRQYNQLVQLYKGSALVSYPQLKLMSFDLVTLVQVIEHIEQQYLPSLNQNVFGYLRPKWVWLSTPNSEFNSLFKWQEPHRKFRHDDHKFEWTRKQFQEYVDAVCEKYQYKAEITGVGLAADDSNLDKGFCTQIAIFQRLDDNNKMEPETSSEMASESKHQIQEPIVPLQLKLEHVNICWKSNIDHLLTVAMRQLITECDSKGSLDWHHVTSILRKKAIIKKLKEHNSEWTFDYHLKSFVFDYLSKHPEAQIGCSKIGIRQLNPKSESENLSIDFTMLDEEFEREMSEWKTFSREEQEMIEADKKAMQEPGVTIYEYDQNEPLFKRRSDKSKKAKSQKSVKSKKSSSWSSGQAQSSSQSSQSSSKKSENSENSWGSVELMEDKRKRKIRRRPIVRPKPEGQKSQEMEKEGEDVVNKAEN